MNDLIYTLLLWVLIFGLTAGFVTGIVVDTYFRQRADALLKMKKVLTPLRGSAPL
ncbi:hypothetical protein [Tellurirhabdus rosea]|uniref:hypothetical protein n=1 Tax=Tellurirhabdus rosea TaxID=2674997 RepID=UPI0022558E64|nr:hypothetical protein [Tellurirhabdus rosea]